MTAAAGTRWQARVALLVDPPGGTRGARWLRRRNQPDTPPPATAWDRVAAMPAFVDWPDAARTRLGLIAALIEARGAIDATLSGARLAPLAALVGEDAFDALCARERPADHPRHAMRLPDPAACLARGAALLAAARIRPEPAVTEALCVIAGLEATSTGQRSAPC